MLHDVIPHLRHRPHMFGVDESFSTHVAFLYGFSAADDRGELPEYRKWLVRVMKTGENMSWVWLVLKKAFPEDSRLWDPAVLRDVDEERAAVETLIRTLEEFLATRGESK